MLETELNKRSQTNKRSEMTAAKKLKLKKCKAAGCDVEFVQYSSLKPWCSEKCRAVLALEKFDKLKRKEALKTKRERLDAKKALRDKDRSWWLKATQADVNKYCRWRDRHKPCITCGKAPERSDKFLKGSGRDAGHYLTRAAYSALRFDIRQIFAQCVTCNRYNSGRRHEFREAMIKMYDLEFVEWLESQTQPRRWEVDELKAIRADFRSRLKQEQQEAEAA